MTWAFHDSPEELSPAQLVLLLALCDAGAQGAHVQAHAPETAGRSG
jgi:hypothetical protein